MEYSKIFDNFRGIRKKLKKMRKMKTEDFRIYMGLQTVPIEESRLKNMHDEIMKIVDENYFIQQRLIMFKQLGCRIFIYKNGPDGLFERLKRFIITQYYLTISQSVTLNPDDSSKIRYLISIRSAKHAFIIFATSNPTELNSSQSGFSACILVLKI